MNYLHIFTIVGCALVCTVADDTESLFQPCGSRYPVDEDCVREFFAEHGSCSVVTQPNNKPVMKQSTVYKIPVLNMTAVDRGAFYINLGGLIERFYINNETQNLVMSILMQNVSYGTPAITFYFHRIGQEPIIITDTSSFRKSYPNHVITATIPLRKGRVTEDSLRDSIVSAFVLREGTVDLDLGEEVRVQGSANSAVWSSLAKMEENEDVLVRETLAVDSFLRFLAYLQKDICDFDMPV